MAAAAVAIGLLLALAFAAIILPQIMIEATTGANATTGGAKDVFNALPMLWLSAMAVIGIAAVGAMAAYLFKS